MKLVKKQAQLIADKRFDEADALRAQLSREFNVSVDDETNTWRVGAEPYQKVEGSPPLPPDAEETVVKLLDQRSLLRAQTRFAEADSLMVQLAREFNVSVDDKTKTWQAAMGLFTSLLGISARVADLWIAITVPITQATQ